MFTITNWDFLIRNAFIEKAAEYIRSSTALMSLISFDSEEAKKYAVDLICDTIEFFGFKGKPTEDGIKIYFHDDDIPWGFGSIRNIPVFEEFCRVITRTVEPGSFIEFSDDGELVRYVFLYDVVEKWSVPHVLFEKKEAI